MKPTKHKFSVLKQICELIPGHLVTKLAKKHGVDIKSRTISPWSHVVAMLYAQVSHSMSLNDICDSLKHHASKLNTIRGATPPSRNGLSHANKIRHADMAQELFWHVLEYLQNANPKFGYSHRYGKLPRRFKRLIHIVDSTTIQLVSNCMDWAKHRRRKAAAKCHLRLNLQTFLPSFAVVREAKPHDCTQAKMLCSGIKSGEIVVFDKAYLDYDHLYELKKRGVFWVTRAKKNLSYIPASTGIFLKKGIVEDRLIQLYPAHSKQDYPKPLRLVTATILLDGKQVQMSFLTNNTTWSARSIADLYKSRWAIEVFFKQLKQTLQLSDFLGYSKQAVQWQIWTALLSYLLLRFLAFMSNWKGSFSRLFTTVRAVLWSHFHLFKLLNSYGTAHGPPKIIATPYQAYLPGFAF